MIQHLLVHTDGSENAGRALHFSAQVIDHHQPAEVTVLYVHLPVPIVPPMATGVPALVPEIPLESTMAANEEREETERAQARQMVDWAVEDLRRLLPSPDIHVTGRVVAGSRVDESILRVAQETHADMIVVGTRGVSALRGAIMGSVSHALIAKAECPVLVVK
ncbi:MAG: universal stress protein [Ktedonobacteraceae bacterium]